ncbi:MAG: iron chelate uptake ABC transporter family permease subunit, partial [Clostridiales bacterium]|nr:iron chelate uptake ABC transporter family permease subunit [Clostridiales bacterium]
GAAFVTLCDLLARTLFAPYELPVGVVLSFLGGPFFLWLILRQRGGGTRA